MKNAFFAIRDGARRKVQPCAFMRFSQDKGFEIELVPGISPDDVPAFFVPFVKDKQRIIPSDLSLRWIQERIPPSGRQNLGEILNAHNLSEYSELELLRSGRGESSQDSFIVEEIDEASFNSRSLDYVLENRQKLGSEIKARRTGLGMSQKELADAVGIDQPALSKIESGKSNVTFDILSDIDNKLTVNNRSLLAYKSRILWDKRRQGILERLEEYAPDLSQVYKRLIDELEVYSETAPSAMADSRVISHCFRELMNSFPAYIDGIDQGYRQADETKALKNVLGLINEMPQLNVDEGEVVAISADLYRALISLKEAHSAGSLNNAQLMQIAVGGKDNDKSVPISAWKKAHDETQKTSHLPRGSKGRVPSFSQYENNLSILENAIEVRVGSTYGAKGQLLELVGRANRVDSLGKHDRPSNDEVERFVSLLGNENLHALAFRELKNPLWLEMLKQEGYFRSYKELGLQSNTPLFAASFLQLCLGEESKQVIDLVSGLSRKGWYAARFFLVDSAKELSDELLKSIMPTITKWAKEGYEAGTYFWIHTEVSSLLEKMLSSTDKEIAKQGQMLFQELVRFRSVESGYLHIKKVYTCIPEYHYGEFVNNLLRFYSSDMRMTICRNMLNSYVFEQSSDAEKPLPSRIFAWSLEDKDLGGIGISKEHLVPWISEMKKVVFKLLREDPDKLCGILSAQKPLVLRIIMRCLHEYVQTLDDPRSNHLIMQMLSNICFTLDVMFDSDYECEFVPLLSDFARYADEADKERFLCSISGWMDAWEKTQVGKGSSSEEADCFKRERELIEYAVLSAFPEEKLPEFLQRTRQKYESEYGVYDGPRVLYKVTTVWGPNSPYSVDQLEAMGAQNVLNWLRQWVPASQDRLELKDYEGVSRRLTSLVKKAPFFFNAFFDNLRNQKLIYLVGIIDGWREALKDNGNIPIENALVLCRTVADAQDSDDVDVATGYERDGDGSIRSLRNVVWLLDEMLRSSSTTLADTEMHDSLQILLECRHRGLEKAQLDEDAFWKDDPVTASLNMLSSIALSGIVSWLLRGEEKSSKDVEQAFKALDDALSSDDVFLADVAAVALQFRGLLFKYRDWVEVRYERIFGTNSPTDGQRLLLSLQISAFRTNAKVLSFLQPALENALSVGMESYPNFLSITNINSFAGNLGYRLFQLYAGGEIELDNGLMRDWYSKASASAIGEAVGELCDFLRRSSDATEAIAYRIQLLWESLAGSDKTSEPGLLQGAFDLMASRLYSHGWIRKALLDEAQSHDVLWEMKMGFDDVFVLASEDPAWGVRLLRFAIEHDQEKERYRYSSMPHSLIKLYRDKFGKPNNDDVCYCMDELGRIGILDLDLL